MGCPATHPTVDELTHAVDTLAGVLIRADWPYQVLTSVRPVGGSSFDVVAANESLWIPSWEEHALYVLPDVDAATG